MCAESGGPLLALSDIKQQLTIPSLATPSRRVHLHLRPQSRRLQEGKRWACLSQALQRDPSPHRGTISTLGSLGTEQGSAYDRSMAQRWPSLAPAPVQTALTACRWKGVSSSKEPPSGHRLYKDSFIGHTEFCLAGSSPGPRPHHFCLDGSGFFSFCFFIFLGHRKDGNMEFLVFFWNLQGSHFIFSKVKVFLGGCLLSLVLRNIIETGLSMVSP